MLNARAMGPVAFQHPLRWAKWLGNVCAAHRMRTTATRTAPVALPLPHTPGITRPRPSNQNARPTCHSAVWSPDHYGSDATQRHAPRCAMHVANSRHVAQPRGYRPLRPCQRGLPRHHKLQALAAAWQKWLQRSLTVLSINLSLDTCKKCHQKNSVLPNPAIINREQQSGACRPALPALAIPSAHRFADPYSGKRYYPLFRFTTGGKLNLGPRSKGASCCLGGVPFRRQPLSIDQHLDY